MNANVQGLYTEWGHRLVQDTHSSRESTHLRKYPRTKLEPVPPGFAWYAGLLRSYRPTFSADGLKPLPTPRGVVLDRSAGRLGGRVHHANTTMHANTHDRDGELFETGEERLRPTYVQHPRTWDTGLQALKRLISRGKTATSNTSKVEPFLPDYRHRVLFSLMSSFRDVGGYLGRIGRKSSALRNRAVERSRVRFLRPGALDVNRTALDVAGRCHR